MLPLWRQCCQGSWGVTTWWLAPSRLGLSFSQPCQTNVELIDLNTHSEASALVGACKKTRRVSIHLLVLQPGGGTVRSFSTQSCPEIIWKRERYWCFSCSWKPQYQYCLGRTWSTIVWHECRLCKAYKHECAVRHDEDTLKKPLCVYIYISLFWKKNHPWNNYWEHAATQNNLRLLCASLTWLSTLSNLHWASCSQCLQQLLCSWFLSITGSLANPKVSSRGSFQDKGIIGVQLTGCSIQLKRKNMTRVRCNCPLCRAIISKQKSVPIV